MRNESKSFTIKVNGKMYIGDLCYAMSREDYHNYWGSHNYEDGAYETPDGMFAMVGTAYGDGCYEGSDGFEYGVDAGIIGICDGELVKRDIDDLGKIVDAYGEAEIAYEDGTIYITYNDGHSAYDTVLEIKTSYDEEDEDEEDYEEEDPFDQDFGSYDEDED